MNKIDKFSASEMKIRQAGLSDQVSLLPQILIFEKQHAVYDGGKLSDQCRQRAQEDLERNIKKKKYWVVEVKDKVVGFIKAELADYHQDTVLIDNLFVQSGYRGYGIGTKLMEYIEELFKKRGAVKSSLWVAKQNVSAERLYRKRGFKLQENIWKKYLKEI